MSERIACFIGQITQDYQREVSCAIREAAEQLGYEMCLFSEFGSYGENYLHAEGEKNIINLPCLDQYAAIIVGLDTFDNNGMTEDLIQKLEKVSCPVISIRQKDERFYNILVDDRTSMAAMIEHFIVQHGKKKICFMTGRMDMEDARERLKGYEDTMAKYDIPITEHMLFYGDFWRYMSEAAVEWFLGGDEQPEVIACANDYMAMSVCDSLRKRGIRVPEDIAVSGFDDVEEARFTELRIASVRVPAEQMGLEAVFAADRLIRGKKVEKYHYVPVKASYEGTCGCRSRGRIGILPELYKKKEYLRRALTQNAYMNVEMENANSIEDVFSTAYAYSFEFPYNTLYICLNERDEEKSRNIGDYADHMVLRAIFSKDNGVEMKQEVFERKEILPIEYRKLTKSRYIFPLHFKNHCLGYVVIQIDDANDLKEYFPVWVIGLASYLDRVSLYEENKGLLEYRKLSVTDELTGLYNRRMVERFLKEQVNATEKTGNYFFLISTDMDGLKFINDTYGHLEGDEALISFADILKEIEGPDILCARVGGDEFTICIANAREENAAQLLINDIESRIDAQNEKSHRPYHLSASFGYAKYEKGEGLVNCLRRADMSMYSNKKQRKRARNGGRR